MAIKPELDALILATLQEGPKHGYDIAKAIRDRSQELIKVGEGRLYPALHALEEHGMVCAEWVPQEGKPSRKVYSLTESGKKELADRKALWEKYASRISAIMNPRQPLKEGSRG